MQSFLTFIVLLLTVAVSLEAVAVKAGDIAPDFELMDLSGNKVGLSGFNNHTVLLVFGATWCPHCRAEIPELKALQKEYGDRGLKVVYIDVQESVRKVESFVRKNKIDYTVLLDQKGTVARRYRVTGIPLNVVISPGRKVKFVNHYIPRDLGSMIEKSQAEE